MAQQTQISAVVAESTRDALDRYADAHGLKKGHVIEVALLTYLQALREIPPDLFVPPYVELDEASAERVLNRIANPRPPTEAMRALLLGKEK
jgi:uncharacterized protein (DUF1778 family)